jgi:hypothetical protein
MAPRDELCWMPARELAARMGEMDPILVSA